MVARLKGTMQVQLGRTVQSQDGRLVYREGEIVNIAIAAGADVRVWQGDRAPVLATFKEVCGATVRHGVTP